MHHAMRLCAGDPGERWTPVQILPLACRSGVLGQSINPPISAFPLLNTPLLGALPENHPVCTQFSFTRMESSSLMFVLFVFNQSFEKLFPGGQFKMEA